MLYQRKIEGYVRAASLKYPIIAILGPRQSGKTTLAKTTFPNHQYVSLEDLDIREYALRDPRGFLSRFPEGVIIDEIQRAPDLLSYLQGIVDSNPIKGRYILTGSHQLMLHSAINQSLAGRVNLVSLLPLSYEELASDHAKEAIDNFLIRGFYPRIYHDDLNPTEVYRNYVQTYVERDVRLILNLKDLRVFEKFLKLCAGRIGQVLNYESLAGDVGVSPKTIKEWMSILEASFIVYIMPPYFENFGKRVTKSPKFYFLDVGLASYLLDIHSPGHIARDPLRGALFENYVVVEILKYFLNRGLTPPLYFFRENNGHEVDLLIKQGHLLTPLEIKSAQTFHDSFFKHLRWLRALLTERIHQGYVIYDGQTMSDPEGMGIANWRELNEVLQKIFAGLN